MQYLKLCHTGEIFSEKQLTQEALHAYRRFTYIIAVHILLHAVYTTGIEFLNVLSPTLLSERQLVFSKALTQTYFLRNLLSQTIYVN